MAARGEASEFQRIMRPQGVALPILNLAVWIRRKGKLIQAIRIAVGPSGPTPRRALEAEAILSGNSFSSSAAELALEVLLSHATYRSSPRRATADYRRDLTGGLFTETLQRAWNRTWE
jgi:carbon-monoxide dehydrogenase medium subunit